MSKGDALIGYRTLAINYFFRRKYPLKSEDEINFAINKIQKHQENTLGRSFNDFKKICPSKEFYDQMLQKSLQYEEELVPKFFASPMGEAELRSDFEIAKPKMCTIDCEEVFASEEWTDFFVSLEKDMEKQFNITFS